MPSSVADILHDWADRTSRGAVDMILQDHASDAVIFDVLPPLRHDGTAAYRASWGGWQPATEGAFTFRLEDLSVTEGADLAFAHGTLRCEDTTTSGAPIADLVRATFCLVRAPTGWRIAHQHISAPRGRS